MGKSKKRNFNKGNINKGSVFKRSDAIKYIIADLKSNIITEETKKQISLFGIKAEELTEAGATLEELSLVNNLIF